MIAVMDIPPFPNILGFLALLLYVATLLPSTLKVVIPSIKKSPILKWLLKHRRALGLHAFTCALFHGYILVKKRNLDFFDVDTFWIYIQGIVTFSVFAILALTSNDWSMKKLRKNWRRLHQMTYLAMFLLTWHVLDKMAGHWTYLTPVGSVVVISISILFLSRLWKERQLRP